MRQLGYCLGGLAWLIDPKLWGIDWLYRLIAVSWRARHPKWTAYTSLEEFDWDYPRHIPRAAGLLQVVWEPMHDYGETSGCRVYQMPNGKLITEGRLKEQDF